MSNSGSEPDVVSRAKYDALHRAYEIRLEHAEGFVRDVADILGGGETQSQVFGESTISVRKLPSEEWMLAEIRRLKSAPN